MFNYVRVTMKNAVFLGVIPRVSCKNRHFGGMYRLHYQGEKNKRANGSTVTQLLNAITIRKLHCLCLVKLLYRVVYFWFRTCGLSANQDVRRSPLLNMMAIATFI
jgi:hypothetical protein